ncbi:MAG: flagellar basal body rod protein [Verrucomicrobia bacterium]|nr:flagellar basal body rod protein [Verrucomicrobiota bacterium]
MSYEASMSGIRAALIRLRVSANDVANANTERHTDHRVVNVSRAGGGVDANVERTDQPVSFVQETVEGMSAAHEMKANAAVLRTQTEMDKTVLDLLA